MQHSTILFDLDGTLTDPREGITRSVQYALAKLGIDEPDLTALEHFIGPPLLQCFMSTYALDEATGWQAVNYYRERFRVTGLVRESGLRRCCRRCWRPCWRKGGTLYVATSKPTVFAEEIARHFGFDRYFKRIYGSELDGTRTNKVELLAHVLESERLAPHSTLMIGDRKHDLIGARCNGLQAVAVGYGFGSREELLGEAPDFHFETLEQNAPGISAEKGPAFNALYQPLR